MLDLEIGLKPPRPLLQGERSIARFIVPPPPFQRPVVWTQAQQIRFLESFWSRFPTASYVVNRSYGNPTDGWLLDGQQRWTALLAYVNDEFPVFGFRYSEITEPERRNFNNRPFPCEETDLASPEQCLEVYDRLAYGGTPHDPQARVLST